MAWEALQKLITVGGGSGDAGFAGSVVLPHATNVNGPLRTWSLYSKPAREAAIAPLLRTKGETVYSLLYQNLDTRIQMFDNLESPEGSPRKQ